jgi:hypothetical protein
MQSNIVAAKLKWLFIEIKN